MLTQYNLGGIWAVLFIAFLFSSNRSKISLRLVLAAMAMHFGMAFFFLKNSFGELIIYNLSNFFNKLYEFGSVGSLFLFGSLAQVQAPWGFVFAIKVLPVIIFFGAFMSLLFYLGIIQFVVKILNFIIRPILGTSGAETLCAISNSFLGQTESPLVISKYLDKMSKSEIAVVMISGMGTISAAVVAVYATMGVPIKHLLISSLISIPATILISKILYPQVDKTLNDDIDTNVERKGTMLDAISKGTVDGLHLALNVGAMLIAFLGLMALANYVIAYVCSFFFVPVVNLEVLLSFLARPFAYILGFTGNEAIEVSKLLGIKVAINELFAYKAMLAANFSERTVAILTYALCGFSNFSSVGIQIGGIGSLMPNKSYFLSEIGIKAVLGGFLANLLSALVVSIII